MLCRMWKEGIRGKKDQTIKTDVKGRNRQTDRYMDREREREREKERETKRMWERLG